MIIAEHAVYRKISSPKYAVQRFLANQAIGQPLSHNTRTTIKYTQTKLLL